MYSVQLLSGLKSYIDSIVEDDTLKTSENSTLVDTYIRMGLDQLCYYANPQFKKTQSISTISFTTKVGSLPSDYFYHDRSIPQVCVISSQELPLVFVEKKSLFVNASATFEPMYTLIGSSIYVSHDLTLDFEYHKRPTMIDDSTEKNDFEEFLYASLAYYVIGSLQNKEQASDEEKARSFQNYLRFYKEIGASDPKKLAEGKIAVSAA